MITLFWKIERGFEARHQVEQPLLDRTNPRGECPLQLIKRRASLQRCDCLDEIAYRLRLNQIELAIEKSALGEFATAGRPRAGVEAGFPDPGRHQHAAVTTDLHHIFTGVTRRPAMNRYHYLVNNPVALHDFAEVL